MQLAANKMSQCQLPESVGVHVLVIRAMSIIDSVLKGPCAY